MTESEREQSAAAENRGALPASLGRLAAGLALEATFQVQQQIRGWESAHPADIVIEQAPEDEDVPVPEGGQLVYGAYALANRAAGSVGRVARLAGSAAHVGLRPVRRLFRARLFGAGLFAPLRAGFNILVERGEEAVGALAEEGRTEANRSRQMARDLTQDLVGTTAAGFADNPGVNRVIQGQIELILQDLPAQARLDALVQALAANYLIYLQEHPEEVKGLVHSQADIYIDHLQENPQQVQNLVQGQSVGLVTEIGDEIRGRLVTADSLAEMLLRRVLRRKPRDLNTGLLDGQQPVPAHPNRPTLAKEAAHG